MKDIIIVGFGGHAKSVADSIERAKLYRIVGYTDVCRMDTRYEYLGTDVCLQNYYDKGIKYAVIGVGFLGKGQIREKLYRQLKDIGYELPSIVDPSSVISSSARIGEGTFIGKNAVVNADAVIGKMSIINTSAIVEHECIIGDFAHVSVASVLCGQVKIGNAAFVGSNATVIQCREISNNTIVPAGAVVR